MDFEDSFSTSSASSSSCSSSSSFTSSSNQRSPSGLSTACSMPASRAMAPSPKRKAGRKKFRETRHPVYHGVRERNGGRWVCEVREPHKKDRIWLGTFRTPEMAARAHDVAAIALRGESAHLNFPDSAWALPRARSSAAEDVRRAAAEAAEVFGASETRSQQSSSSSTMPPAAPRDGREADAAPEAAAWMPSAVFVDEEALFNMPALLDDMARGLLLTPPAMQRGFDWDRVDEHHMDLSLWAD
ncbi:AP2 ERF domain-containing transcription factor [Musa troglodytarum]|uniref:AP2 ERF domain-containing transcription factor n=1 Tax=Musa troglodytarum TaxID=320322 RepID=A0A9E7IIC5_9LILI|nr:AP2 ERF domain-containing transcription factor [Musa troglodytarum]